MTTFFGYPVKLTLDIDGEPLDATQAIDMMAMPPTIRPDAVLRAVRGHRSSEDIEEIAHELYAQGPWGKPFQFVEDGAHLISDAHSMDVYRDIVRAVVTALGRTHEP